MSTSGKRLLPPSAENIAAKRVKHIHNAGRSSSDELSIDITTERHPINPIPHIDLTEDVPMPDVADSQTQAPSIGVHRSDNGDGLLLNGKAVTAASPLVGPLTADTLTGAQWNAASRDMTPEAAYDVCFGMLFLDAICSVNADIPTRCTPVVLEFDGKLIRICHSNTNKRIAIIYSPQLWRLVDEFPVTLTATICGKSLRSFGTKGTWKHRDNHSGEASCCSLRIAVYGFRRQGEDIADLLFQERLFLQHPGKNEFDGEVEYMNPQYLLPPGETMPPLEKLCISTCCSDEGPGSALSRGSLTKDEKNQVFKIFDSAYESVKKLATIEPSPRLVTKLKRHQTVALAMMIEKEAGIHDSPQFPSIWKPFSGLNGQIRYQNIVTQEFSMSRPPSISGGILADEMGLGKTLSSLSLICHSLDIMEKNPSLTEDIPRSTLIITPKSTLPGWEKQIVTHIDPKKVQWMTYHGPKRHRTMKNITSCDIVLTTYETLRSDRRNNGILLQQAWMRVILDEAHRIRNSTSHFFGDVCAVRARNRWCLTGTPIQNSLEDFRSLLSFIGVPLAQDGVDYFDELILQPIKKRKPEGLEKLRQVVVATCLRRTKADSNLELNLPQKTERVERVEMNHHDRRVYAFFKRYSYVMASVDKTSNKRATRSILVLISLLRLICDHGEAILPASALKAWKDKDETELTWEILESNIKRCVFCDCEIEELKGGELSTVEWGCGHVACSNCVAKRADMTNRPLCPTCRTEAVGSPSLEENSSPQLAQPALGSQHAPSAKVEALLRNITKSSPCGTEVLKHVVFSQWTKMLDLIETALRERGMRYLRIDGRSGLPQRKKVLEKFREDSSYNIMLASIGAAGEGIDLTAAKTVHLVEPHWNPMAEAQAVDRVHRIGQQKDVEVIRYIVQDSIEVYMQWVQMDKMRLIKDSFSDSKRNDQKPSEVRWQELLKYLE